MRQPPYPLASSSQNQNGITQRIERTTTTTQPWAHRIDRSNLPYKCGMVFSCKVPSTGGATINQWLMGYRDQYGEDNYFTNWGRDKVDASCIDKTQTGRRRWKHWSRAAWMHLSRSLSRTNGECCIVITRVCTWMLASICCPNGIRRWNCRGVHSLPMCTNISIDSIVQEKNGMIIWIQHRRLGIGRRSWITFFTISWREIQWVQILFIICSVDSFICMAGYDIIWYWKAKFIKIYRSMKYLTVQSW